MFLRITGRIFLNVQSMNAQGGGGTNYIEITKVPIILKSNGNYKPCEVPAISGNMIKHYHFVGFTERFKQTPYAQNLTWDASRAYVALRFDRGKTAKKANGQEISLQSEGEILSHFADADLHGFLAPDTQCRRESILKFSFFVPVEEFVEEVEVKAVVHNRVDVDEEGKIPPREEGAMMFFKREYTSAPYGFLMSFDLPYSGLTLASMNSPNVLGVLERQSRVKSAILGLMDLLSGRAGASLSRAFPAAKVEELIVASSEEPLPALVHGFYKDYAEQSAKILKAYKSLSSTDITVNLYARNSQRKSELEQMLKDSQSSLEVKVFDDFISLLSDAEKSAEEVIASMAMKELKEIQEKVSLQSKEEIKKVLENWQNLLAKAQEIYPAIWEEYNLLEQSMESEDKDLKKLADELREANSTEKRTELIKALREGIEKKKNKKKEEEGEGSGS
ncbi:MAG TPA: type I-A CRISPR-associated protein Cas7/Csa2 [Candidatus Limnocylindrales bacterium]|nr:type I-A CRISPR-associated protein Cas7/Csa2 [Candidatus Limnocylindrales bacterium]